jgi:hypothetical protein
MCSTKWLIATAMMLFPLAALADDLPSELLLRCEVKQTHFITSNNSKTDFDEKTYTKDFRLKDGVFGWTNGPIPVGTDCRLVNGDITCAWSGVIPLNDPPLGPRVEKRQSTVRLSRTTGEIRLTLETWGYPGDRVKGNPDISMKLSQSGVCRTIGKPLF